MNIIRRVFNLYDVIQSYKDPRVEAFPFTPSYPVIFALIFVYRKFVFYWGPKFMESRKPYNLTKIINIYNIHQIVVNFLLTVYGLYFLFQPEFSFKCGEINNEIVTDNAKRILFISYLYYINKIVDLLDTVFFVLRKKNSQITFLHVYHHCGMVFNSSLYISFMGGSHGFLIAVLNAAIHTMMYTYYFLTSYRPELRNSIWWKKHLTQLQLIQFVILLVYFVMPLIEPGCNYPKIFSISGIVQNSCFILLFSNFYHKAYLSTKNKKIEN